MLLLFKLKILIGKLSKFDLFMAQMELIFVLRFKFFTKLIMEILSYMSMHLISG